MAWHGRGLWKDGWWPKQGLLEFERHLKHSSQFDGSRIREEPFRACEEIACRMALGTVSFNQSPMRSRAPVVFPLGVRVAAKRVSPQFGPGGGAPRDAPAALPLHVMVLCLQFS